MTSISTLRFALHAGSAVSARSTMTQSTHDKSTESMSHYEKNDKIKVKRDEKKTPFLPRPIRDSPHPNAPKGTHTVRLYVCMYVCMRKCVRMYIYILQYCTERRRVMVAAKTENGAGFVPW